MRGLDPRIHRKKQNRFSVMDCRVKPGNDREMVGFSRRWYHLSIVELSIGIDGSRRSRDALGRDDNRVYGCHPSSAALRKLAIIAVRSKYARRRPASAAMARICSLKPPSGFSRLRLLAIDCVCTYSSVTSRRCLS